MSLLRRVSDNRRTLRTLYYMWVVFPYPLRKPLTALGLLGVLGMKKLFGVNRSNAPTPMDDLGNLSFWGVPEIDLERYTLRVDGEVENPLTLTFADLTGFEMAERPVRMDCVGGFRNNSTMKGFPLALLLDKAGLKPEAESAVFHCADGYFTTHRLADLMSSEAFMACEINDQRLERFGYPLRLAALGTYGYKWAKWVVRIELVKDFPKGYWEQKGLPARGKVGDIW